MHRIQKHYFDIYKVEHHISLNTLKDNIMHGRYRKIPYIIFPLITDNNNEDLNIAFVYKQYHIYTFTYNTSSHRLDVKESLQSF